MRQATRMGWAAAHPLFTGTIEAMFILVVGIFATMQLNAGRDLSYVIGAIAGGIALTCLVERVFEPWLERQ